MTIATIHRVFQDEEVPHLGGGPKTWCMRNSPWLGRHTLSYAQQLDYKRDHEVRHWEWGDGALGWKFGAVRGAGGPHDDRLGNFLQSGSQGPSGFLRPCFPRLSYPPSCLACQAPPLPTVTPYCRRFALRWPLMPLRSPCPGMICQKMLAKTAGGNYLFIFC